MVLILNQWKRHISTNKIAETLDKFSQEKKEGSLLPQQIMTVNECYGSKTV